MSSSAKVLTGLMERRALEAAFQELAETDSLDELVQRARAIAEHGSVVVPMLTALLDTSDPQVRGGLGQVAAHLERENVVPALKAAARARDRSDHARLTAMMILDRYLSEPIDESLLAGLQDPDAVAVQSLRELSHEMEQNPFVVIEYLNQLNEQPAEVAGVVLDAVPRLGPDPHLVTLLRMFAQGPNHGLAVKALEQLSRTRLPDAASALASLSQTLPPDLASIAARGLLKLRLLGTSVPAAASASNWRALLSPVDGTGAQVVWFVSAEGEQSQGTIFSILCKDPEGIIGSFGTTEVPAGDLPPANPPGGEYLIRQGEDGPSIRMLEVPVDAGRRVVRQALDQLWARHACAPLEYRLLNPLIWDLEPLSANEQQDEGAADAAPAPAFSPMQAAAILDHPEFASWFWQAEPAYSAAEQLGWRPNRTARAAAIVNLIEAHFDPEALASFRRRLRGMAEWLALDGQAEAAALAQAAAQHLDGTPPNRNPFLQRLVGRGLDVASANLRSGFDLRQRPDAPA